MLAGAVTISIPVIFRCHFYPATSILSQKRSEGALKPFSRPFFTFFCYEVQPPLASASPQLENGGLQVHRTKKIRFKYTERDWHRKKFAIAMGLELDWNRKKIG